MPPMYPYPPLSVVMPVRAPAPWLEASLAAVLDQDYPGDWEVMVALASGQVPGVLAEVERQEARLRVVENPAGTTPAGLNAAISAAKGEVIARVDAQSEIPPGYLRRAVEVLQETGADNVGGMQVPVGQTDMERAIAVAMASPLGSGGARYRSGGAAGPVDTVYLGVFRRVALDRVGGFDETLERNQDYDLNIRLRTTGGVVWFDPALRVVYRPRSSLPALARQYFEYGRWKREVLRRHPHSLRLRQLAPLAVLAANAAALVLAASGRRWGLAVPGAYAGLLVGTTHAPRLRTAACLATMHLSWAIGFTTPARHVTSQAPAT